MDTAALALGRFAADMKYEDLPPQAVARTKRLILDTIGCALGGYGTAPCSIARGVVEGMGGAPESTIMGSGVKTSCANAALVNGAMVRYWDFNDTYWAPTTVTSVHPSNCLAEALAVAERQHAGGKDLILAVVLGYEVQVRLCDAFRMPHFHGGHAVGGFSAPVVAGKLLRLNAEQIAHAIGIAGSHNFAIDGIYGEGGYVSMMKCIGYAFAAQSGVTAALLAQQGFTGPVTIIESYNRGFEGSVPLTSLTGPRPELGVLQSWMKPFPAYHMGHTPITATIQLVKEHGIKPQDVDRVSVRVFSRAGGGPMHETRRPQSKEEADHSLVCLVAIAIAEGDAGPDQFARELWKDPTVLDLIDRVEVQADKEFDKLFPRQWPCVVEIRTKGGRVYSQRVDYSKGAPQNPMTDQEINRKFTGMASELLPAERIAQVTDTVYHLEELDDTARLMGLLVA